MGKAEILAPCGSPQSLEAALRTGCDAVYLGGEMFSARQNAANFSKEELKKAVLCDTLEKYITDILTINGQELVRRIYTETRINATDKEMEIFYNKYVKTLRLKVDAEGNFKIEILK